MMSGIGTGGKKMTRIDANKLYLEMARAMQNEGWLPHIEDWQILNNILLKCDPDFNSHAFQKSVLNPRLLELRAVEN